MSSLEQSLSSRASGFPQKPAPPGGNEDVGPDHDTAVAFRSAWSTCAVCQGIGEVGHPRRRLYVKANWPDEVDETKSYRHLFKDIYIHYPNLVLLDRSAQGGCRVCALFLRLLKLNGYYSKFSQAWAEAVEEEHTRVGPFDVERDTDDVARLVKEAETQQYSYKGRLEDDDVYRHTYGAHRVILYSSADSPRGWRGGYTQGGFYAIVSDFSSQVSGLVNFRNTLPDPSELDYLSSPARDLLSMPHTSLVRKWMETCALEHETCRMHLGQEQALPTRVLAFSSDPATGEITHLHLLQTRGRKGVYGCLSYCWGLSFQKSMTTTSNLGRHLESIPCDSLPKTVHDAVRTFAKLGFRYAWVDSLCIIQDDAEDWLQEASKMAEIYSGSSLTLAVHLCDDSSQSFLEKRQQPEPGSIGELYAGIEHTDDDSGEKKLMHLWPMKRIDPVRFNDDGTGKKLSNGPRSAWARRAWTFQEYLLSPRVLHVHQMTQWDCFEGYGNELETRSLLKNPHVRTPNRLVMDVDWSTIVELFTKRLLTRDMDRLAALSGLADQHRKLTGKTYLAGLWLEDLPLALLYYRQAHLDFARSPTDYRAPSWSWASLEGPVSYDNRHYNLSDSLVSVIAAHCEYSSPGALSTATSGWVDIEGPIAPVIERENTQFGVVLVTDAKMADSVYGWEAFLDQDTCSRQDIAQDRIWLLQVIEPTSIKSLASLSRAIILQKGPQSAGRDTFRRLGFAWRGPLRDDQRVYEWERKIIRLI